MLTVRLAAAAALCIVAAAASSAQAPVAAPVQQILLYSYGYTPSPIVLAAGKPVTLTFVNRAGKSHDFTAPKFFASSRILAGHVERGEEIELNGGQSASVTLIPAAGEFRVRCSKPFHTMLGMSGKIIVR
jgi:plastocyanin